METKTKEGAAAIQLQNGLGIGYVSLLAEVSEEIELRNGTHYLLARNGRGKTTLLKTLAGLLRAVQGNYELAGRCQFVGDDLNFDCELTSVRIFRALIDAARQPDAFALADRLELDVRKPFGKLSFGNRKKVGLIMAEHRLIAGQANVLLYDEPFTGLDTPAREAVRERWKGTEAEVLRVVSCHPDFDGMEMPQALLISDGKIFRGGDGTRTWSDFKNLLN